MTNKQYRLISSLVAVLTVLTATEKMQANNAALVPKVVVNIIVDQLRSDYIQAFMPLYENDGFKKLLQEGWVYNQAENPSAFPDRASAATTVITGTPPANHGIIALQWIDKATLRPISCVGNNDANKDSTLPFYTPKHIQVSTLGDEVKIGTQGRGLVYGIAPFKDEAVLTAGHAADGAFWVDEKSGNWTGTPYFGEIPGWVHDQNQSLSSSLRQTWKPFNERVGAFRYFLSGGKQQGFSHKFSGNTRIQDFKTSALINEAVSQLTQTCIEKTTCGIDDYPDLVSVTFYAGTYKNEPTENASMELQDTYVRLDKAIADIIRSVEHKVGLQNALIALTSTGAGSKGENIDLEKYRIPTGVVDISRAMALLNMYLGAIYGQGQYVESTFGAQLYLNHKLIEQKQIALTELLNRSQNFLLQLSGVKDVYTSNRLIEGSWSPTINKIKNAYNARVSGDILIEIMPGWHYTNDNHQESQQMRADYVPFPIVFLGRNLGKQQISTPVSIDYIAPTLAKAMRIRAPNASSNRPLF